MRTWLILTARTHHFLVSRPDWGDPARLAALTGGFLAVPVVGTLAVLLLIAIFAALDRAAQGV